MSILSAFSTKPKAQNRSYNPSWLTEMNSWFMSGMANGTNATPLSVQKSLTVAAVFSANKLMSEIPASLDLQYRVDDGDYFEHITDGNLAKTLRRPNYYQNSYTFFQSMFMRMNLDGNSYAYIKRSPSGEIQLLPIDAGGTQTMTIGISPLGDELFYFANGVPFSADEIVHFRNMSFDGILGLSPIFYASRMLNNAIDSERYMSKFYENGIVATGFFTTAERLTEKTYARMQEDIKNKSGIDRAGQAQILEQGLKFERNTINAADAAIIEAQRFSVEEVCRIYRIPKHLLYLDSQSGSGKSFSTQAREFLTYSLSPMLNNIQEELGMKLLPSDQYESGKGKIMFDTKALLRVDPTERAAYYKSLFNIGAITPNEIRADEGMKPLEEGGDDTFVQLNLAPLDMIEEVIGDKITKQVNSTNG
jgi:HK97 family phage portal protein